jgi:hypothetical protein
MKVRAATLVAYTYGRGAWTLPLPNRKLSMHLKGAVRRTVTVPFEPTRLSVEASRLLAYG